jgi:hypothetical protein
LPTSQLLALRRFFVSLLLGADRWLRTSVFGRPEMLVHLDLFLRSRGGSRSASD